VETKAETEDQEVVFELEALLAAEEQEQDIVFLPEEDLEGEPRGDEDDLSTASTI
jgi:hypothetical protein